jgi:hypothetical protein
MIIFIYKHCPVSKLDKLIHELYKSPTTRSLFLHCQSLKYTYITDADIFSYLNGEQDYNYTHYVGKEPDVLVNGFIELSEFENIIVHTFNEEIIEKLSTEIRNNNLFTYNSLTDTLDLIT